MTHVEWGLLAMAAALILGGLLGGPVWYAAGHRHGRTAPGYRGGPQHRRGDPAPGFLLDLPPHKRVGAYGPFPVSEEELALLTSPLLPAGFEAHAEEAMTVANVPIEYEGKPAAFFDAHDLAVIAVHGAPAVSTTDLSVTAWTAAMAADMDRYIAERISETDEQLKEITR